MGRRVTTAVAVVLCLEAVALVYVAFLSTVAFGVGMADVGDAWGVTIGIPVVALIVATGTVVVRGLAQAVRSLRGRARRWSWSLLTLSVLHGVYGITLLLEGQPPGTMFCLALSVLLVIAAGPSPRGFVEYRLT